MSKKFKTLDYSRGWDDYWRDHPQGYSPQEQMINWSGQLNAMIDFFNEYFDVDLAEYATDVMEGWYFDGRLDDIINEALFNSKADKTTVNELTSQLADIAINVKKFGAVGDGVTDDTTAVKAAIAYAESLPKATILFPASNGFKVTETIYVNSICDVKMESPLLFDVDNNTPGLVIGDGRVTPYNNTYIIKIQKIELSDWYNENCVGVKLVNCNNCNIRIDQADDFTIGVQCIGSGGGFAYNNVELIGIRSNKIGLDLTNETANDKIGWCNENLFLGGRFSSLSSYHTDKPRYGVRITSKDRTYVKNNNNVFLKPSFELKYHSPHEAIPILLEYAEQNSFLKIRNEGNSLITARVTNNSTENEITTGYGNITIEDVSDYPLTLSRSIRRQLIDNTQNIIFNSGPMHKKACYSDGATSINVPNIFFMPSTTGAPSPVMPSITLNDNYLELTGSRACGIFVDTSVNKRFVLRRDIDEGYEGRIGIKCFDAVGNLLTDTGTNHPYVKGTMSTGFVYVTTYGGMYRTGIDTKGDRLFMVGDDVKYIAVMMVGGTNPLRIRSFSIASVDGGSPACWTGYEEIVPGANIGTAPPTAGTWEVGRRVVRIPEEGQPKAWVCTVAGTPGTWVSEGSL